MHGFYSIGVIPATKGADTCDVEIETRRLSATGELPVDRYELQEETSRLIRRNSITGLFLGGFEGKPGSYQLAVEVMSDTACLDAGQPHLYVIASGDDFYKWNQREETSSWVCFLVGLSGFAFIVVTIFQAVRERSDAKRNLSLFRRP